jgi:hypothetical protein
MLSTPSQYKKKKLMKYIIYQILKKIINKFQTKYHLYKIKKVIHLTQIQMKKHNHNKF